MWQVGGATSDEETKLINWILKKIQRLGHPIDLSQRRLKVVEIVHDLNTPFTKSWAFLDRGG